MFKKLKTFLSSELIQNTLKLSSSNAILMFLPLVVIPILSRIYTPEDYGVWGIFSSVLFIINSFIFLSYENTIVKSIDDEELPSLIVLCLIISSSILLIIISFFVLGEKIGIPFFVSFPSIQLLFLTLSLTALYNILGNIANRAKEYGIMSFSNVINGSTQAFGRLFLGFFPIISFGLIVGNISGILVATLFLSFPTAKYLIKLPFQNVSIKSLKKYAKKYKKFPLFDAPARFIEFSVINIVIIILANFFGQDQIGCFSMVIQFILLPISVIGSAISKVYYREISENQKDINSVSLITLKIIKITFILSLAPLLFLTLGGDKLLVFVLGDKWIPAGGMALIMSIFSLPLILTVPLLPAFRTLDKQEIRFKLNLISFILAIGSLFLSVLFFNQINVVLLIYSIFYAFVQFLIFYKILEITNVSINSVSKYFIMIIGGCYILLGLRIYYSGFLF